MDPTFILEVVVAGLLSGVMYSLVALGFVLVFKASGVFNFAQGAMVLFAALTFVLLQEAGGAGPFWAWTGWLSVALAVVAVLFFFATRYTKPVARPAVARRVLIAVVVLAVIVLAISHDGGTPMWRALFVAGLLFAALAIGLASSKGAAAVLIGLAAVSLLPGMFSDSGLSAGWNFWRSLVVTLAVMIALAIAIERIVLRPLVNQEQIILFMATIGLNFLLEGTAQGVWDSQVHVLDLGIEDAPIESVSAATGVFISRFDVIAAVIAAVLVAALAMFFNKTRIGRALRAVADDHQAALSVGIPLQHIWVIVWSAAGVIALVAGLLWGSRLGVQFSLSLIVLKAMPVLIIGGLTSISGAIVGGLIVGVTEKLFEVFIGIPLLGGGTEDWVPYMLAILFLLIRPHGLFGERVVERV